MDCVTKATVGGPGHLPMGEGFVDSPRGFLLNAQEMVRPFGFLFLALALLVAFTLPTLTVAADPCHQQKPTVNAHEHESADDPGHHSAEPCAQKHASCCHLQHVFLFREWVPVHQPVLPSSLNARTPAKAKPDPDLEGPFQPPRA